MWGRKAKVSLDYVADDFVDFCRQTALRSIGVFLHRSEQFGAPAYVLDGPPTIERREQFVQSFQRTVISVELNSRHRIVTAIASRALNRLECGGSVDGGSELAALISQYTGQADQRRLMLKILFKELFGSEIELKLAALPVSDFGMCRRYVLYVAQNNRIDTHS